LHARTIWDSSVECVFVHFSGVTTIAAATGISINDNLSVKSNRGGILQVIHNVESISKGAGSTLSPTGATVLRDVLVLGP